MKLIQNSNPGSLRLEFIILVKSLLLVIKEVHESFKNSCVILNNENYQYWCGIISATWEAEKGGFRKTLYFKTKIKQKGGIYLK
jgi:hypothetical protein